MRRYRWVLVRPAIALLLLVTLLGPAAPPLAAQPTPDATIAPSAQPADDVAPPLTQAQVARRLGGAPLLFVENVGQFDPRARFQVRGGQGALWLAEDALWITLLEPAPQPSEDAVRKRDPLERMERERAPAPHQGVNLRLSFEGANPAPRLEPFARSETRISYFIGNDPEEWYPDVPVWGGVRYVGIYPGLDLEVTGAGGQWAWRMVARDGGQAALADVRLRVEGAEGLSLGEGALRAETAVGAVALPLLQATDVQGAPLLLPQEGPRFTGGVVAAPFAEAISADRSASVQAGGLVYSTYLGGSIMELGYAIAADEEGRAYVTGWTWSPDYPTTAGASEYAFSDYTGNIAFVSVLNATGTGLAYSTFLGGSVGATGLAIALDGAGQAYVAGETQSPDYPTTAGAYDTSYNGGWCDVFVTVLNAAGTGLVYSTFLGGSDCDLGEGIAVDGDGRVYVTGETGSTDYPTTAGAYDTTFNGRQRDAFVSALNATGTGLVYSTFLGGDWDDAGAEIAVDAMGRAFVVGETHSTTYPTTAGAYDTSYNGGFDAFVSVLNPEGATLIYSTYLGGSDADSGKGIAVDAQGRAYITGWTESLDYPTTADAIDTSQSHDEVFVSVLNAPGASLIYSTFLGGSETDWGYAVTVDGAGKAYVTGWTESLDYPTTAEAYDRVLGGYDDVFVSVLSPEVDHSDCILRLPFVTRP